MLILEFNLVILCLLVIHFVMYKFIYYKYIFATIYYRAVIFKKYNLPILLTQKSHTLKN